MPCLSDSCSVRSKMARLAAASASTMWAGAAESSVVPSGASSRATICTAIALATSPAAWPPMPSATMNSPRCGVASA